MSYHLKWKGIQLLRSIQCQYSCRQLLFNQNLSNKKGICISYWKRPNTIHFTTSPLHKLATIFLVLLLMIILATIANLKVIYSSIQIACLFWNCFCIILLMIIPRQTKFSYKISCSIKLQFKQFIDDIAIDL